MLDPYRAVDLASRLIRADAMASGMPANVVDIPSAVTAPDGGVDGLASESPRQSIHGLVKKGTTAYQFRTGAFAPGSSISDILFDKRGEVKPRIRSCVERGGTLVVLLFGWDGTARTSDGALAERFRAALAAKSGALADAKVDVWGLNRIAAAVGQFPGLAADVGGGIPADTPAMSHDEWSRTADMAHAFKHGRSEDAAVGQIRAHLRGGRGMPVHARVSGQPGSGKTRLVLEATRADDLAPRVVYAANPSAAMPIVAAHTRRAGGARLIVVVDECDMAEEFAIWNRLRNDREGADLVTIYNEPGLDRETTMQVMVEGMGGEQIAEILEEYMKNAGRKADGGIGAWVKYCGRSPRAAHIVGRSLAAGPPSGPLEDPGGAMVWERYVAGIEEMGGREYRDRLTVLLWLSQFSRFGFGAPYERDGERIAEIVHRHHPEIPAHRFREVVRTLRSMKVLQGGSVLYITPRILHEHMWLGWWERYGPGDAPCRPRRGGDGGDDDGADTSLGGGETSLLPTLYNRYCGMLASMRESRAAAHAVESLFGRDGPLGDGAAPEDAIDSYLFEAASAVSPAAALGCAEAAADRMRRRGWRGASAGQWLAAVAAGRRMLGRPDTFARSARLLLALADGNGAGDDGRAPFGPDAGDALRLAFDPAPEAGLADVPLAARLDVLAGAVRRGAGGGGGGCEGNAADGGRNGEHARLAALRACGAVLEMRQFSIAIPRQIGAGSCVRYWQPKDRAGLAAYLRGVLGLLAEAADDRGNSGAVRQEAADAVLASLAQAALLPEIAEGAIRAAERMRSAGLIDGGALLAAAEHIAASEAEGVDPAAMRRIRAIIDEGRGAGGLHERLAWRVGRDGCAHRGRFGAAWDDGAEIARLAGELAGDAAVLESELEWLFGKEASRRGAAMLGREIAARDADGALLGRIEGAARRAAAGAEEGGSMHFLAGYLAGMCRERPDMAEDAMDRMLEHGGALCGALPAVAGMAGGVSDRSARRLARAAADGGIRRSDLGGAVRGGTLDKVSEEAFWMVAGALVAGGAGADDRGGGSAAAAAAEAAGSAALDIVHGRYAARGPGRRARRLPAEAVAGILLHERVLGGRPSAGVRHIDAARWTEAALALARQEEGEGMAARMADAVIGRLGAPGMFEEDAAAAAPVLDEIAREHPRTVWRIAASFMGPPLDKRACIVRAWLAGRAGGRPRGRAESASAPGGRNGGAGGIGAVPASVVLEWAAEDPHARARRAAEVASPPRLDAARELVARFGHLEGVADGAAGALEAWQARAAQAADREDARARLESMRRGERDPAVAEWLDRCIGILGAGIAGPRVRPAPLLSR